MTLYAVFLSECQKLVEEKEREAERAREKVLNGMIGRVMEEWRSRARERRRNRDGRDKAREICRRKVLKE